MAPTEPPPPLEGKKRRIGVLTSGGDAPGMNGAVRSVVRMSLASGCEAYAVYEGYDGLVKGGDMIKEMEWDDVRGFLAQGGTLIGTARCMEFRERDGRRQAAKNMVIKGIDALIVCGGDGSLTGADRLRDEWPGLISELVERKELTKEQVEPFKHLNIVGLVGSIDNDMSSTDATIGCYTSLHRICEAVDAIEATAYSHQRAFVIKVMGRHCGWLCLMAAVATGADFCLLPEKPPTGDWRQELSDVVKKHRDMGKRKTIVIVAEGAHDRDLNPISCQEVNNLLSKDLQLDSRVTELGHVQRGGAACAYDRMLPTLQGVEAVKAVLEATPDTPSPVISIVENKIVRKPLLEAVKLTQDVTKAIEAKDFERAVDGRDAEFREYLKAYSITTAMEKPDMKLPEEKRMRIGIMHVGAPAGGMNSATRAAIAYCLVRGHTPITLLNGFTGLCRHHDDKPIGAVRYPTWLEADGWASLGGSEIGTNRHLPEEDMEKTAWCFEHYKLDAFFVVGGFEAFTALSQLRLAREKYDAFKIPMTIIPATVSNNVPGTEYSLGSDTSLNQLINFCDTCRQSSSSSRRCVFVIETQGGYSGYMATIGGLAIGAVAVYTAEEGISIKMLSRDIDTLRESFAQDRGQARAGKTILVNEKASDIYTAERIAKMINSEARGRFEAKSAIPGHFLQGTVPSPMDRVRAVRFGVRSIQHIELYAGKSKEDVCSDPLSCALIGIRGAKVKFTSMHQIETQETDWKKRRPINEFWMGFKETVDMLSGRPGGPNVVVEANGVKADGVKTDRVN